MKRLLWDVDTQVDFIDQDGKLAVPNADAVVPAMARLVEWARREGIPHVASVDDHELTDPEISESPDYADTFPPHCLRGTHGAAKIAETEQLDPRVADAQRRRLDALLLDALTMFEGRTEQRRPAHDRRVQVVDRNPDVVDAAGHETTSSTVAIRTPPPCQSTMHACDRSSSMPHDASSTKVTS